jgi:hypothetical protein
MKLPKLIGLIIFFIAFCFSSCQKKDHLHETILALKRTGQFVTAEFTLGKIVKASDDKTWYKIGDRKILISLEAHLKAGINFLDITEKDFSEDGSVLSVTLPPAQIFSLSIPPEKIKLEHMEIGLLRSDFSAAEREDLLAQAEGQIRTLADSLKILDIAQENAELYLEKLLQQTGFEKVRITFSGK